jgi:hypothetical protein
MTHIDLDCCAAANLPPIRRALAQHALDWLTTGGVDPAMTTVSGETISG